MQKSLIGTHKYTCMYFHFAVNSGVGTGHASFVPRPFSRASCAYKRKRPGDEAKGRQDCTRSCLGHEKYLGGPDPPKCVGNKYRLHTKPEVCNHLVL